MKCIKIIMLFVVVSLGVSSCSMGGGHTRCAAYTMNESSNDWVDVDAVDSKEFKEADFVY